MKFLRQLACSILFLAALASLVGVVGSSRAVNAPKSPEEVTAERKISS